MSLLSLHKKYSFVDYQNELCSIAAFVTLLTILFAVFLPLIFIYNVNHSKFSSSDDLIVYEQPMVKFQFRYIFLAENSMESNGKVVLCSSFDVLNRLIENDNCAKMKVVERDENFDGKPDEIDFTVDFETLFSYGTKSLSLVLFLDARLEHYHCSLHIPAMIIIKKKTFSDSSHDRKIIIKGSLQPNQLQSLVCPFFLRNVKSHFFHDNLAANETNLDRYKIGNIQEKLERNPMHFYYKETSTDIQTVDTQKTTIEIKLKLPQVEVRYKKTFWQIVNDVWINYVAVLVVTVTVCKFFLNHLFENRWLMARKKDD